MVHKKYLGKKPPNLQHSHSQKLPVKQSIKKNLKIVKANFYICFYMPELWKLSSTELHRNQLQLFTKLPIV